MLLETNGFVLVYVLAVRVALVLVLVLSVLDAGSFAAETVTQREDETSVPSDCTPFTVSRWFPSGTGSRISSGVTAVSCGISALSIDTLIEAIGTFFGNSANTRTGEVTLPLLAGETILTPSAKPFVATNKNANTTTPGNKVLALNSTSRISWCPYTLLGSVFSIKTFMYF